MARGRKKKKRPLKDGTFRPPGPQSRATGPALELSDRQARRVSVLLAVLAPLTLIGLEVLGTNPDYETPAVIIGVMLGFAALFTLALLRTGRWFVWPGVVILIALVVLPWMVFKSEVMHYRGVQTDVVITGAHSSKTKGGGLSWSCGIRRADGLPLPHARLPVGDCWGPEQVGTTTAVMVDPGGWVPPASTDDNYADLNVGVACVGVTVALWALLALRAGRRPTTPG